MRVKRVNIIIIIVVIIIIIMISLHIKSTIKFDKKYK